MKLRLKGNSLRLRVSRTELTRLQAGERIAETILLPSGATTTELGYALEAGGDGEAVQVTYLAHQIVVNLSQHQLVSWSDEDQVGVYALLPVTPTATLDVAIEKDFACLDRNDADNEDTFVNPLAGKTC